MKDFDSWNEFKKHLEVRFSEATHFPLEGEVWVTYVGTNLGYEQDSNSRDFTRPSMVIKKFNNKMMWVIPLSNKQKDFDFYFNFTDPNNKKVSVILAQMKLVSIKRLKRKMYAVPAVVLDNIKLKLVEFLKIENPQ